MDPTGFFPNVWALEKPPTTACPADCLSGFRAGSEKDLGSNPNSATFKLCALSDSESQSPYCEGGRYGMSQGVAGRTTLNNIESFGHSVGTL